MNAAYRFPYSIRDFLLEENKLYHQILAHTAGRLCMTDVRLVGVTAENIFLSLLNEREILSHTFDTSGFDGIIFDINNEYFKIGNSPFYVQIKCRGSKTNKFNSQGHSPLVFNKIRDTANKLKIPESSLYFIVGFYKNCDIREMNYYIIPFDELGYFKKENNKEYRFTDKNCDQLAQQNENVIKI